MDLESLHEEMGYVQESNLDTTMILAPRDTLLKEIVFSLEVVPQNLKIIYKNESEFNFRARDLLVGKH